jgi:hypothetical protein
VTQVARPASDVSNSGWSPTPLFSHINPTSPNDASPISCSLPPGGSFEVQLAAMARPITGPHTLTVRFRDTAPVSALVTFFLLQGPEPGAQVVAARSVAPTPTFTSYTLTLTEQEVDLITDYAKLVLRVLAGGSGCGSGSGSVASGKSGSGIATSCSHCPVALFQWKFTLSGITNGVCLNCGALNKTWVLTYSPSCQIAQPCTWDSGGPGTKGNVNYCLDGIGDRWFLVYSNFNGFNGWHLVLAQSCTVNLGGGAALADYQLQGAFNCLGSNTFGLFSNPGCNNMPATITIVPA